MLVQIKNLDKTYGNDETIAVKALQKVSFELKKKDYVAVCGPSGSGKTTLLTIMAGLHHPTGGEVVVDDISLYKELGSEGLARFRSEYVGFVFQSFNLISYLNAIENVMIPLAHLKIKRREKLKMAKKALKRVGLEDRADHLPSQLSGGQRQRVAIARAIVNEPMIIFADEPTGNLDTQTRDEILDLFDSLRDDGHTIIMVTHDPGNIKKANRIIEICDGKLVA